jgi:cardiolipin synthase (CMP-forming)
MVNRYAATLPNVISFSRIVLAVAFALARSAEVRVAVALLAAFTDFLDGWIARHLGLSSRLGALIDPITDRAFMLVAFAVLVYDGLLGAGQLAVILSRDIATTIGFFVAKMVSWLRPVTFKARLPGKLVTVLQFAAVLVALLAPRALPALVIAIGVCSVAAIADYTLALWRARDLA